MEPRTLRQGRGQGRSKKDEDALPGVRRIQLRKCLIEIGKMATVLRRGGGLVGSVTAHSIDRSERIRDAFLLTTRCQILYIALPRRASQVGIYQAVTGRERGP